MVIYLNDEETTNALEAVRTAMMIREEAVRIREEFKNLPRPLAINMGINSGQALVGAAKFESITGSRWTYTARGTTTNVAARIGALATGGRVYLSAETAERINTYLKPQFVGNFKLKNVSHEVGVFEV
jgi:class 3 adenylate cyclase